VDAHIHATQDDVLLAGGLGVKADGSGEECRDPTRGKELSPSRLINTGQNLQKGALPGAVGAHDGQPVTLIDIEIEIGQGQDLDPITPFERFPNVVLASRLFFSERLAP